LAFLLSSISQVGGMIEELNSLFLYSFSFTATILF
jgi:hypothetical protein